MSSTLLNSHRQVVGEQHKQMERVQHLSGVRNTQERRSLSTILGSDIILQVLNVEDGIVFFRNFIALRQHKELGLYEDLVTPTMLIDIRYYVIVPKKRGCTQLLEETDVKLIVYVVISPSLEPFCSSATSILFRGHLLVQYNLATHRDFPMEWMNVIDAVACHISNASRWWSVGWGGKSRGWVCMHCIKHARCPISHAPNVLVVSKNNSQEKWHYTKTARLLTSTNNQAQMRLDTAAPLNICWLLVNLIDSRGPILVPIPINPPCRRTPWRYGYIVCVCCFVFYSWVAQGMDMMPWKTPVQQCSSPKLTTFVHYRFVGAFIPDYQSWRSRVGSVEFRVTPYSDDMIQKALVGCTGQIELYQLIYYHGCSSRCTWRKPKPSKISLPTFSPWSTKSVLLIV